jgi:hypothetical protein
MTKSEFNKIDHSIIWLWQVEKEMRDMQKSYGNVWSDWTRSDAYRFGRLEALQEVMTEKGVKFLKT